MNLDSSTIDRIVAGVLNQLAAGGERPPTGSPRIAAVNREASPSATSQPPNSISETVVTADTLSQHLDGSAEVVVATRAIVTPAARDLARERGVEIVRSDAHSENKRDAARQPVKTEACRGPLLLVVRSSEAVDRLWNSDLGETWQRELLGCPDDAAAQAISAICRGEASLVVILATQTHRAACLANRNENIKAVALQDAGDVRTIRKQLRANVWCLDPAEKSWFELRTLLRAITQN